MLSAIPIKDNFRDQKQIYGNYKRKKYHLNFLLLPCSSISLQDVKSYSIGLSVNSTDIIDVIRSNIFT